MLKSIPSPTCMTYATFTHLQSYEAKEKYQISLLHFKGFPFMTEHIFSPATNKQTNNGGKKTKKQIKKLSDTLGRK